VLLPPAPAPPAPVPLALVLVPAPVPAPAPVPDVDPEVAPALDPIVVDDEKPVPPEPDADPPAGIIPGGHGFMLPPAVFCCAPADAANAALRTIVMPAARHRMRWCRSVIAVCIACLRFHALLRTPAGS
jgi:hypothetical protein